MNLVRLFFVCVVLAAFGCKQNIGGVQPRPPLLIVVCASTSTATNPAHRPTLTGFLYGVTNPTLERADLPSLSMMGPHRWCTPPFRFEHGTRQPWGARFDLEVGGGYVTGVDLRYWGREPPSDRAVEDHLQVQPFVRTETGRFRIRFDLPPVDSFIPVVIPRPPPSPEALVPR